jgi:HK97 family phage prohead protease
MKKKNFVRSAEIKLRKAGGEAREWPVTISTDTPYERDGYAEALSHKEGAIDFSRAPLPVIESHDRSKVNIGTVSGLRSTGHKLQGYLKLGNSARAKELADDIDAGIVTGISIGYRWLQWNEDREGNVMVTRWEPFETSIVAVPADIGAGINRSLEVNKKVEQQPDDIDPKPPEPTSRERNILALCDKAGLDLKFARSLVEDETVDMDTARHRVIDKLAESDRAYRPSIRSVEFDDHMSDFRSAAVDSLLVRSGIPVVEPHAAMRDIHHMGIKEMARTVLRQGGVNPSGMGDSELFKRSLATSDFPAILVDAANKALRQGLETEEASHTIWVKQSPARDFKTMHRPILGSAPDLEVVNEFGEYTHGGPIEDDEGFAVTKYGRAMRFSWEAFVNDDLSAFTAIPMAFAMAARRKEADIVYSILTANSFDGQTMNDTNPLFHASHNNLAASSSALDAIALDSGRALMRKQTGVGGGYLNLRPVYLLVAPDHEGAAERLIAQSTIIKTGTSESPSEWISSLVPVVEPRLDGSAAYLAANSQVIDTVELATLDGHPAVLEDEDFIVDARSYKCRHVFGARCLDWRGLVKIPISG